MSIRSSAEACLYGSSGSMGSGCGSCRLVGSVGAGLERTFLDDVEDCGGLSSFVLRFLVILVGVGREGVGGRLSVLVLSCSGSQSSGRVAKYSIAPARVRRGISGASSWVSPSSSSELMSRMPANAVETYRGGTRGGWSPNVLEVNLDVSIGCSGALVPGSGGGGSMGSLR